MDGTKYMLCVLANGEFIAVNPVPIAIDTHEAIDTWVTKKYEEEYSLPAAVITYFFIDVNFGRQFLKVEMPGGSDAIRQASIDYAKDLCWEWRIPQSNETYKQGIQVGEQQTQRVVNTIRDYLDDGLDQVEKRFADHHEDIDVHLNLLDGNLKITKNDNHYECIIPIQIEIDELGDLIKKENSNG